MPELSRKKSRTDIYTVISRTSYPPSKHFRAPYRVITMWRSDFRLTLIYCNARRVALLLTLLPCSHNAPDKIGRSAGAASRILQSAQDRVALVCALFTAGSLL